MVRQFIDQFCTHLPDHRPVGDVTAIEIALWLSQEAERGLQPGSVDARYRALQALFGWCEQQGIVSESPFGYGHRKRVRRPKRPMPVVDYVKYSEYQQVVAGIDLATWIDYRDYCICSVLYWCGLRRSELVGLAVADVDITARLVTVRAGKGGRGRLVPVDHDLLGGLMAYMNMRPVWPGPELWLSADGPSGNVRGALTADGVRQMLERRCAKAGVRYLRPHLWRHGFAMAMLNAGAELSAVGAMLGHSSTKVTEAVYARWLVEGLIRQYDAAVVSIKDHAR